ncbi:MAG TPA: rhodanese-like domain-containing protein, partial [Bryobacteraceae bacterium]|nr:rhodanese-like domain-containing protein [Bryobacteraceae bacterium]
ATVFGYPGGPCYPCLYSEPPPPGLVPSCAEGGVLGILPGTIGLIQATETVKLILGIGEPLVGRLLLYDALAMRFRELKLRKNPDCPVCGVNPTVTELIDVREPHEYKICNIPGAKLIPLGEFPKHVGEFDPNADIVIHCRSGMRSAKACAVLRQNGFQHVRNVVGGILAWSDKVDPSVPKY